MPVCDVTFSGFVIDSNIIFSIIQAFKRLENIHFYRSYDHGQLLSRVARALEKEVSERPLGAQMNTGFRDNSFLPFLSGVFIEDWQTRYWMFWEFPSRLLEAPLWCVRQDPLSAVEGFSKLLKACDQCLVYGVC
ncbi:hypothetical protein DL93DRAFT_2083789 [Clavulina sp. PMI_390]|nr:hypothetical protein DL93DRAFT_2083789 [Clavulina sp. PMI_390]